VRQEDIMHPKITHPILIGALVAAAAGAARAGAGASAGPGATIAEPEPIDSQTVPAQCRQYLAAPAGSASELRVWSQRLSLAACQQDTIAAPAPTSDPAKFRGLVESLDSAMQPSTAIYRDAMAHGPPQIRMLGAFGVGMTAVNLMVRARSAIPASRDFEHNLALHNALEPLLAGHARDADAAFAEVDRLATEFPADVSANPVVKSIVAGVRAKLHGRSAK
jgi:hypothetical protein